MSSDSIGVARAAKISDDPRPEAPEGATGAPAPRLPIFDRLIGWIIAGVLGGLAIVIQYLPFPPFRVVQADGAIRYPVGAAVVAILLGALSRNVFRLPAATTIGTRAIIRRVIPLAIVLIGAGLNLGVVREAGASALAVILAGILVALIGGIVFGGLVGAGRKTSILLGAGTAICGSSAIVAIAPLVRADEDDLVLSIGTVNLLGLIFMIALPAFGVMIDMSGPSFGVWAGATIHAVPQAVAAGFAYPAAGHAGEIATLVKLVRVAMLAPLVVVISLAATGARGELKDVCWSAIVPWFIWGFVLLAVLRTLLGENGVVVDSLHWAREFGGLLFTLSMAALGLEVDLRRLAGVGSRALLAGALTAIALSVTTFALLCVLL